MKAHMNAPRTSRSVGSISPKAERSPSHLPRKGAKPLKKQKAGSKRNPITRLIGWLWRWCWRLAIAYVAAVCSLILIYLIPQVRPVSMLMLRDLFEKGHYERQWVPLSQIAPVMQRAVIVSEDGKFCTHAGVDWGAVETVIDDATKGKRVRGASTIAMQTVKNLFLWSDRSYIRKGMEVPLALLVDAVWSKERLLEIYLNSAEWGTGLYGIEAASKRYFGISATHLSAWQAAALAATLPNPTKRNPANLHPDIADVAHTIESRAYGASSSDNCLE